MTCEDMLSAYFDSLKSGSSCKALPDGRLSIVLPFLYPDHDNIEVFVKETPETIIVSDFGETLRRLDAIGTGLRTSGTIAYQTERITSGLQVSMNDGAIFKEGHRENVAELMFDVVSACMAIGDLAYSSRGYQPLTFADEVAKLLDNKNFRFEEKHTVRGRSTTEYRIDFMVPMQRRVSYIQTMGATTANGAKSWVNATYRMWGDIEVGEGKVVRKVSLLNEEAVEVKKEDVKLLEQVSKVYRWEDKPQFVASLTNGTA